MIRMPISILLIEDDSDRAFMEQIYLDHSQLMYKVAYRVVGNHQSAEDMVSEACIALIRNITSLRKINVCKRKAYVVSTIRNVSINYVKKRNRQGKHNFLAGDDAAFDSIPYAEEVDDELIRQAEQTAIVKALDEISARDSLLLRMHYFDLATDIQIAEALGIGKDSVRYYLTKARRSLKEVLAQNESINL